MMLPHGFQYGFIAQEVETVLPELVSTLTYPAKYDSSGTLVDSSFSFKGLSKFSLTIKNQKYSFS